MSSLVALATGVTTGELVAQRFANEFATAQAAGSDLSNIRGVRTGIEELRKGVPGRGPYAQLVFQVRGVSDAEAKSAARYLTFDRSILRFRPPVHYSSAWTSGSIKRERTRLGATLSELLAERTAESFARVFNAAQAAAANLKVDDVESAMRLLEEGVNGKGSYASTTFRIAPPQANVRQRVKKLLSVHEGNLYFIRDANQMSPAELNRAFKKQRPALLAQQVATLYNAANLAGADFSKSNTPSDVVAALRSGVPARNQLGRQFFRLSVSAPEQDWKRVAAYLRYRDGLLIYMPPTRN